MWLTTLLTTMGTIGSTIIYVIPIYRHLAARKKKLCDGLKTRRSLKIKWVHHYFPDQKTSFWVYHVFTQTRFIPFFIDSLFLVYALAVQ